MFAQLPTIKPQLLAAWGGVLQRACTCGNHAPGGECEECKKKRVQRRATTDRAPDTAPPIVYDVLRTPGQPLDGATRAFMEPRFGHDFSRVPAIAPQRMPGALTVGPADDHYEQEADQVADRAMRMSGSGLTPPALHAHHDFGHVRVHTNARAMASAQAVHARAYTVGRDIVFGAGQYAPHTSAGRRLLAHELAHTIQQSGDGSSSQLQRMIGDGHDLTAARFAGDVVLEAVFDGEQILRKGAKGTAVQKIQHRSSGPTATLATRPMRRCETSSAIRASAS